MSSWLLLVGIAIVIVAIGVSLMAGYQLGGSATSNKQLRANAEAIKAAADRALDLEIRDAERANVLALKMKQINAMHASIDLERKQFFDMISEGDFAGAVSVAEERNAKLTQDLEAIMVDRPKGVPS